MKLNTFSAMWCPASRVAQMGTDNHGNPTLMAGGDFSFNRMASGDGQTMVPLAARCVGLACPLFLQHGAIEDRFWCGLGPEPSRFPAFVEAAPIQPPAPPVPAPQPEPANG